MREPLGWQTARVPDSLTYAVIGAGPSGLAGGRNLDKRGIEYTIVDISQDAEALEMVRGLGYLQAPVVVAGNEHWSGFRPDQISALAAKVAQAV